MRNPLLLCLILSTLFIDCKKEIGVPPEGKTTKELLTKKKIVFENSTFYISQKK
jgi:hypothetical protein